MADPDPNGKMTRFDVTRHGFHFENGPWQGDILIDIPVIGRVKVGHTSYGLCGGMSYAALDTYSLDGQTPPGPQMPARKSQLRSYIYDRQ